MVVGVASNASVIPSTASCGYLDLYRYAHHGRQLQFAHRTEIDGRPTALCAFQGRLLVAVGKILRIYDLGKRKVLRKCECRSIPHCIVHLETQGERILMADVQESFHFARYLFQENRIVIFADDTIPRFITASMMLDFNTCAGGDKFGNLFVVRLGEDAVEELDDDATGARLLYEKPVNNGAPYKFERVAEFHVGDLVTSVQKCVMVAGGPELIFYSTLLGSLGMLVPLQSEEEVAFFVSLEMHLRNEKVPLCGRDHLWYRSSFVPVKAVTDGSLVEQFDALPSDRKRSVAEALGRTSAEVSRRIEQVRSRAF